MRYILLLALFVVVMVAPAYAQVIPEPVKGIPTEKLECIFDKGKSDCKPNKRIVITAVYDKTVDDGKAIDVESFLNNERWAKQPVAEVIPLKRNTLDDDGRYEIVTTSYEFSNTETGKIADIRNGMVSRGYATDATFIRITEFDTWHHFGEDQIKPCVLTNVIEFGEFPID